jgi:hypothetical protein
MFASAVALDFILKAETCNARYADLMKKEYLYSCVWNYTLCFLILTELAEKSAAFLNSLEHLTT